MFDTTAHRDAIRTALETSLGRTYYRDVVQTVTDSVIDDVTGEGIYVADEFVTAATDAAIDRAVIYLDDTVEAWAELGHPSPVSAEVAGSRDIPELMRTAVIETLLDLDIAGIVIAVNDSLIAEVEAAA